MGYKSQNYCFETVEQLHSHVAAQCEPISGGFSVVCTPHNPATVIDVLATNLTSGIQKTSSFTPQLISCDYFGADYIQFLWLLAGLLVAAFSARFIANLIMGKR